MARKPKLYGWALVNPIFSDFDLTCLEDRFSDAKPRDEFTPLFEANQDFSIMESDDERPEEQR